MQDLPALAYDATSTERGETINERLGKPRQALSQAGILPARPPPTSGSQVNEVSEVAAMECFAVPEISFSRIQKAGSFSLWVSGSFQEE